MTFRGVLMFLAPLALLPFLCSFRLPGDTEIPDFSEHGEEVDSFITRTIDRVNESWLMCRLEFRLASDSRVVLERDAESHVKAAAEEAVDKAVDAVKAGIKEKAAEKIQNISE